MHFDAVEVRSVRESMLLRLLFRATQSMNGDMAERVRARGFTDFQSSFTAVLAHIDTEGTRVTELAERMGTSRQAVSQLLQAVEARGYIERVPDPDDGRAVIARHTDRGRKILLTAITAMQSIEDEYGAILGANSVASLKRLLTRLLAKVDPEGNLKPGRVAPRRRR
jgi:DNA-binding MarR family transcriptional regulator